MRKFAAAFALTAAFLLLFSPAYSASLRAAPKATLTPYPPVVISLTIIRADRAASILNGVYPDARIRVDRAANALIVIASPDEVSALRTVASGIDAKDPTTPTAQAFALHHSLPADVVPRLRGLYPNARFVEAPNQTVIIVAAPQDQTQISSIVAAIDTPPTTPTPRPVFPTETISVTQANPRGVARAVERSLQNTRIDVAGSNLLVTGPQDQMTQAKDLAAQLDVPQSNAQITAVYRLRYVDASSVADLFQRSFASVKIEVDKDLNAITVLGNEHIQRRIADAIAQLDVGPQSADAGAGGASSGGGSAEVVQLAAALPSSATGPSTTAQDMAQTVTTALQGIAPDLKITVPQGSTSLILTGSPYSIQEAKALIAKLDVLPTMVVLDTEILEVDEGTSKNLGISTAGTLSTVFTEIAPTPNANGVTPSLQRIQPIGRTQPLTLSAALNFLITTNHARVLEDPRLTTVSGRTASLRAGETYNVLTTTGGGTGVVATQQVQSFQTGVSLDITPIVNRDDYVTIALHPSVNSNAGSTVTNGIPNIATRDTTTMVGLHDGQTIVIGGLIEDDRQVTIQKLPLLGDLPLVGGLFRNSNVSYSRNELIITVTPHIVRDGEDGLSPVGDRLPDIPKVEALPTLAPGATMPPSRASSGALPPRAQEPVPVTVPTPLSDPPTPLRAAPSQTLARVTPAPSVPAPVALPSAFGQTNIFTYGTAPQNNFAQPQSPPQIFFIQVSPSVVRQGDSMTISAITTTNVTRLVFGPSSALATIAIANIGPGKWQATFPFSSSGIMQSQGNIQMTLNAYSVSNAVATIPIPVSLVSP